MNWDARRERIAGSPVISTLRRVPGFDRAAATLVNMESRLKFRGSAPYWERRYESGGDSGSGSFGDLARFKAEILNGFVQDRGVESVVEFGCGDGNQLEAARYPEYLGLDVSQSALRRCIDRFAADGSKSFYLYSPECFEDRAGRFRSDLALSLDVAYHLVEDAAFERHMAHVFGAARRFAIVYSSDSEALNEGNRAAHVRHRCASGWVAAHLPAWRLAQRIPNRYPLQPDGTGSFAEFMIFEPVPAA